MSENDEQTPEFYNKQPCHAQACAIQCMFILPVIPAVQKNKK
jgi:hypothetical protein